MNRYRDQLIVIGFVVGVICLLVFGTMLRNHILRNILCS